MQNKQHTGQIGEYWLSKRKGSDAWCRTWFDKRTRQTKRTSLGTDDFQQAQLNLAEWIINNQVLKKESPEEMPIETLLVRYYNNHAINIRSAEDARRSLAYWSEYFGEKVVSDIDPLSIKGFILGLRAKGFSEGYVGRILRVGKAALNLAYRLGEIVAVPYIPAGSTGGVRERVLNLQETADLFNAVESEHMFMYLMIAFNTLARPEAILELKKFQVNLVDRVIAFNPPRRKQTKKYRPELPITDVLFPWLEKANTDVLVNWKGKPIKSIRRAFQLTRDRAGLDKEVTPYTIRHTMATELRRREVQMYELAGFLGHSSGKGVTDRYAKFSPEYKSKARIAIDDYFIVLQPLVERTLIFNKGLRVNSVLVGE